MTRYVSHRADDSDWWDNGPLLPDLHVDGPKHTDTGLLDKHGNRIFRVQPPIGFGRNREH